MMKRLLLLVATSLGGLLALADSPAAAQYAPYGRPGTTAAARRPGLSPYLNLLRGGNPAANYYLGTLPEFERRANARQFSIDISDLQQRTTTSDADSANDLIPLAPQTGHPVGFATYGPYYNFGTGQQRARPQAPVVRRGR